MRRPPAPKVVIYRVRDRRKTRPTANPFVLDWRVEGRQRTRAFPTKLAAEDPTLSPPRLVAVKDASSPAGRSRRVG